MSLAAKKGDPVGPRELQVLRELADGSMQAEVADRLNISMSTVRNTLYNVYLKLGVHSLIEAYYVLGWIKFEETP